MADRSAPFLNNLIKSVIGHTEGLTARLGFEIGIVLPFQQSYSHLTKLDVVTTQVTMAKFFAIGNKRKGASDPVSELLHINGR